MRKSMLIAVAFLMSVGCGGTQTEEENETCFSGTLTCQSKTVQTDEICDAEAEYALALAMSRCEKAAAFEMQQTGERCTCN